MITITDPEQPAGSIRLTRSVFNLVLMAGGLLALAACDGKPAAPEGVPSAPAATTAVVMGGGPVEIQVDARGYHPAMVTAKVGEPLTLVFKRVTDRGCGHKILIPGADIARDLPLNEPVEITFTPKQSGAMPFTCGMKMLKGTIQVQ